MGGAIIGFIIWAAVGFVIICIGISALFSKKAVGFWANIKPIPVKDVKGYNRATGKLFICYGIVFIMLGIPLLSGQNNPYILLSVIGVMIETIAIMAFYSLVVTKKYEGNKQTGICTYATSRAQYETIFTLGACSQK